ncbi:MAG: hypothetical protein LBH46_01735, partial [Rickettsiales bacterium]|nr:hypothetical protein [Rickettsiales bacterium]
DNLTLQQIYHVLTDGERAPQLCDLYNKDILIKNGYDSIVQLRESGYPGFSNTKEKYPNRTIVVFEPNQIKSVNNRGTFDINSDNIFYQNQTDNENIESNIIDLTGEFRDILDYDDETKINLINERLKSLIGAEIITDGNEILSVKGKDIGHIKYKATNTTDTEEKSRRTTAIDNLENIIKKSKLVETRDVDSEHNTSKRTRKEKEKWDKVNIFSNNIKIGDANYNVILTTYTNKKGVPQGTQSKSNSPYVVTPTEGTITDDNKNTNYLYEIYTKKIPNQQKSNTLYQADDSIQNAFIEQKADEANKYNKYGSRNTIEALQKKIEFLKADIAKTEKELGESERLENSIARFISESGVEGDKVKDLLSVMTAIFNPAPSKGYNRFIQGTSTLLGVNSIGQALKQFGETTYVVAKNGLSNSIKGMINKNISMEDLGLDIPDVKITNKDINDIIGDATEFILKWTGFEKVDSFGKNLFINSMYEKTASKVNRNNKEVLEEIKTIFKDKAPQVINDFKNNNITDDVLDYIFIKLADIQPITASSKTLSYLQSDKARSLYVLKSYSYKQLSRFLAQAYDTIHNGSLKDPKTWGKLVKDLLLLDLLLSLFGIGKDMISDLLENNSNNKNKKDSDNMLQYAFDKYMDNSQVVSFIKYEVFNSSSSPSILLSAFNAVKHDLELFTGKIKRNKDSKYKAGRYVPFVKDVKAMFGKK